MIYLIKRHFASFVDLELCKMLLFQTVETQDSCSLVEEGSCWRKALN